MDGLQVFTATSYLGSIAFPYTVDFIAMDDSGATYIEHYASINGTTTTPLATQIVNKYAFESTTPIASYTVTGVSASTISASGAGRLVILSFDSNFDTEYIDVWEAGVSGRPSFTFTQSTNNGAEGCTNFNFPFMGHDGTLVIPVKTPAGLQTYNFYPNGSPSSTRTLTESVVSTGMQCGFAPNYMTMGADGTFYVTEFQFIPEDTLAGLYIFPPAASETFVQTPSDPGNVAQPGPAPQSVDVDGAGNVYVANDNSVLGTSGNTPDTLHSIAVYTPNGAALTRTISDGLEANYVLVADTDGTAYISDYPGGGSSTTYNPLEPNGALHVLAAGASSVNTLHSFGATNVVLYNGSASRNVLSLGGGTHGSAHAGGFRHGPLQLFRRNHRR